MRKAASCIEQHHPRTELARGTEAPRGEGLTVPCSASSSGDFAITPEMSPRILRKQPVGRQTLRRLLLPITPVRDAGEHGWFILCHTHLTSQRLAVTSDKVAHLA